MISDVLVFLKNYLNDYLSGQSDWTPGESREDKVVFIDGEKMDPIAFKLGAVSALLVNVEEESTLRAPDPFVSVSPAGDALRGNPEIRMNLYVLFVARFRQYEVGLKYLSDIIQHFQSHRVLDHRNAPELGEDIEKLVVELITLPLSEQNELWSALRTTYHPSVLYRVKMLVFRDSEAKRPTEVEDKAVSLSS